MYGLMLREAICHSHNFFWIRTNPDKQFIIPDDIVVASCFRARAFLDISIVFSIGLVFAFEHLRTLRPAARGWLASGLLLSVVTGYGLIALHHFSADWRPDRDYLFEWEYRLYGSRLPRSDLNSAPPGAANPQRDRIESDGSDELARDGRRPGSPN